MSLRNGNTGKEIETESAGTTPKNGRSFGTTARNPRTRGAVVEPMVQSTILMLQVGTQSGGIRGTREPDPKEPDRHPAGSGTPGRMNAPKPLEETGSRL